MILKFTKSKNNEKEDCEYKNKRIIEKITKKRSEKIGTTQNSKNDTKKKNKKK